MMYSVKGRREENEASEQKELKDKWDEKWLTNNRHDVIYLTW